MSLINRPKPSWGAEPFALPSRLGEPNSDLQVYRNAAAEIRVERYPSITKSLGLGCIRLGSFRPSALSTTNPM